MGAAKEGTGLTAVEAPGNPKLIDVRSAPGLQLPAEKVTGSVSRTNPLRIVIPAAVTTLALWSLLFGVVLTGLQMRSTQGHLYDRFRLELAQETAPVAEPVPIGAPTAMINAPTAHIRNVIVVEGTTARLLKAGPGHLSDTPLPGQAGESVIFGRSLTYGAPFGDVTGMSLGDLFTVTTGQGEFRYKVEDVRRQGDPLPPPLQPGQSRLTFVTSTGGQWTTAWVPTRTAYVDALLVGGTAQQAPAGIPSSVPKASLAMQLDPSGLVPLIFWLEALVVTLAALVWCWRRWGRAEAWLAGSPVLLAALWGTSDAFMRFLPNLV